MSKKCKLYTLYLTDNRVLKFPHLNLTCVVCIKDISFKPFDYISILEMFFFSVFQEVEREAPNNVVVIIIFGIVGMILQVCGI